MISSSVLFAFLIRFRFLERQQVKAADEAFAKAAELNPSLDWKSVAKVSHSHTTHCSYYFFLGHNAEIGCSGKRLREGVCRVPFHVAFSLVCIPVPTSLPLIYAAASFRVPACLSLRLPACLSVYSSPPPAPHSPFFLLPLDLRAWFMPDYEQHLSVSLTGVHI